MKKVRILFLFVLAMTFGTVSFAQGKFGKDSAECIKYLSFYKDYFKQNNMKEAASLWRQAYRLCPPQSSQNLLIDGQKIMKYVIENEKDEAVRKSMVDTLINLHDLRTQYYPAYKHYSLTNKALDMMKYTDDDMVTFNTMKEAVLVCRNKMLPSPALVVLCVDRAAKLYNEGKLSAEEVMSTYEEVMDVAESIYSRKPSPSLESAMNDAEQVLATSGVASCENIVKLFTPKFEADSTNKDLVSGIVKLLSDAQCTDSDLFYRTVYALHRMEPSYLTAYYLYKLNAAKSNHTAAVSFLDEAIANEACDSLKKADYLLELATYNFKFMSNNAKAVANAKNAIDYNPALKGKAYLLIATIWANTDCQGSDVEKRARFWVAVDYLTRAKAADETLSEEANKLISTYRQYFPLKDEAFMYDLIDGSSYTVSCGGLRETTTVRTQQ